MWDLLSTGLVQGSESEIYKRWWPMVRVLDSSDVYQLAQGRRCSWGDIVSTGFVSSEHLREMIGKESPYCSEECIFRG